MKKNFSSLASEKYFMKYFHARYIDVASRKLFHAECVLCGGDNLTAGRFFRPDPPGER